MSEAIRTRGATAELESASLEAILGSSDLSVAQFFESIWQNECAIFSKKTQGRADSSEQTNPYHHLVSQGEDALIDLLEQARRLSENLPGKEVPLIFKDKTLTTPEERALYGSSLFAAFLDGCSVVINHADLLSPYIAALCQDLQKSFPHAYANCYLTPACSQAVGAHADDRDVLVLQVYGSKAWKAYQRIPVPYPYPHEQVGKEGFDVPSQILDGPLIVDHILRPGDCLYMPRGYVHEAYAVSGEASFHVTVAFATHDWTLAGLLSAAGKHIWTRSIENRKAISREFGMRDGATIQSTAKEKLKLQIDDAIEALRKEVTVDAIQETLSFKFARHNGRSRQTREDLIAKAQSVTRQMDSSVVGRSASERVLMTSRIRVATEIEKASLPPMIQPRGLHVRAQNCDGLIQILQLLKGDPTLVCCVRDLRSLVPEVSASETMCDFTLLSFARQCVELGALAVID
jgi:ribosomal protein L16 Arg81 hydroxylase